MDSPEKIDTYFPKAGNLPLRWKALHTIVPGIVGSFCKLFMSRHSIRIENHEILANEIVNRRHLQPLITVSNHAANVDDVMLLGYMIPLRSMFNHKIMRWSAVAYDICFQNTLHRWVFTAGKGIPVWRNVYDDDGNLIKRGSGVYQRPCDYIIEHLNVGHWIQIYPQGKVVWGKLKDKEAELRLRWGVGRLVADAEVSPVVVPFWHEGMEDVSPMKQPYAYHLLKSWISGPQKVTISVGQPMFFDDIRAQLRQNQISAVDARKRITALIQERLYELRESTLKTHLSRER